MLALRLVLFAFFTFVLALPGPVENPDSNGEHPGASSVGGNADNL